MERARLVQQQKLGWRVRLEAEAQRTRGDKAPDKDNRDGAITVD